MESKQLEITCPCCQSRLTVDVRTGALLKTLRPEELDSRGKPVVSERDWSQAVGRVQGRERDREGKLDAALSRERDKADRLEDLFRQAKHKLDQGSSEDETPPRPPPPPRSGPRG